MAKSHQSLSRQNSIQTTKLKKKYRVIGLMSGTSLDGLDIVCADFVEDEGWKGKIIKGATLKYTATRKKWLTALETASARQLAQANTDFGDFMGKAALQFIKDNALKVDFVGAHGHTLFHEPQNGYTYQLGSGAALSKAVGLPVVCDFRSQDVAMGGQGAPLVPIGDRLLFKAYGACVNLGGFANVSFQQKGQRIAFDICPVNIVLNALAERLGKAYDKDGKMARKGLVHPELLEKLNGLLYYKQPAPKSLGKEWVMQCVWPLLNAYEIATADLLATWVEHSAMQIAAVIKANKKVLFTGGGALNGHLMARIKKLSSCNCELPELSLINYKEGYVFAFLAVLRWQGNANCLASVTGAHKNHSAGCIYL